MLTHELLNDESIRILRPQDAPEAAVSGNALLSVGPRIASHFVAAETRHFLWAVREQTVAAVRGWRTRRKLTRAPGVTTPRRDLNGNRDPAGSARSAARRLEEAECAGENAEHGHGEDDSARVREQRLRPIHFSCCSVREKAALNAEPILLIIKGKHTAISDPGARG